MQLVITILLAYLAGSIPFGKIISGRRGVDISKTGSGNIGTANVFRHLGWRAGVSVFVLDAAKGFLPVALASEYLGASNNQLLVVGLAAVLGHIFPVWLKFKGGKGIATGFGVILAVSPLLAIIGLLVYGLCLALLRKSAPSSLAAVICLPVLGLFYRRDIAVFLLFFAALAFWTHRVNIRQYFAGRRVHAS